MPPRPRAGDLLRMDLVVMEPAGVSAGYDHAAALTVQHGLEILGDHVL